MLPKTQQPKRPQPYNVLNEPLEIVKEAGEQITGGKEAGEQMPQAPQEPQSMEAKPAPDEVMKISRMQALEQELKEVREQEEQQEMQKEIAEEQMKKQREEQKKEAGGNTLIEPSTKPKRGLLSFFGGVMGVLKRKQRQTEFGKSPTG